MFNVPTYPDVKITLPTLFRETLQGEDSEISEDTIDCCIVMALNFNFGARLYDSVGEFIARVQKSHHGEFKKAAVAYLAKKGCDFSKKAMYGFFFEYGAIVALGTVVRHMPRHVMALMLWNERWFNWILTKATGGTHCLIRIDKSPYWKDNSFNSHLLSGKFNFRACCWELQDAEVK